MLLLIAAASETNRPGRADKQTNRSCTPDENSSERAKDRLAFYRWRSLCATFTVAAGAASGRKFEIWGPGNKASFTGSGLAAGQNINQIDGVGDFDLQVWFAAVTADLTRRIAAATRL